MAVTLTGDTLTLDDLLAVARGGARVELGADVAERVRAGTGDRRALAHRRRARLRPDDRASACASERASSRASSPSSTAA